MAGPTLNLNSVLKCPHGAPVQIISANTKLKVGGAFAALATDQFIIIGCPFQIPATPPIPSPCVTVQWLVADISSKVNGAPTLSQTSVGMCLSAAQVPQGPVVIVETQPQIQTR
jgi:hypothetical protein